MKRKIYRNDCIEITTWKSKTFKTTGESERITGKPDPFFSPLFIGSIKKSFVNREASSVAIEKQTSKLKVRKRKEKE